MLCALCKKESAKFGWDETSHLGKRPICYSCIGERDVRRINENKTIALYLKDNTLVNHVGTLSFRIIEKHKKDEGHKLQFFFLVNKKRWEGVMYPELSTVVMCRKYIKK